MKQICLILFVTLIFSSCASNINEDVKIAEEKYDEYFSTCFREHLPFNNQGVDDLTLRNAFEKDIDKIIQNTYDGIFEKYGEKDAIVALENSSKTKDYGEIKIRKEYKEFSAKTKQEFYNYLKHKAVKTYTELMHP